MLENSNAGFVQDFMYQAQKEFLSKAGSVLICKLSHTW